MISSHGRLASIAVVACCAVPAAGALAAPASAATLTANKACYVNADPSVGAAMVITGAGFTPGSSVTLSGGTTSATGTADAAGNVSIPAQAPTLSSLGPGTKPFTLTATDGAGISATVAVRSANLAVETSPRSVKNVRKDKVTFSFSGFTPGKHIYGYYVRKKVVAKVKFGKANGPCGTLKQKALLFPGGHPSHDSYKVTFENTSKFSKTAFPRVTGTLSIFHF
jgi:hypothetical protein